MNPTNEQQNLEHQADLARERLLNVIDELDHKRENVTDRVQAIASFKVPRALLLGLVGCACLAAAIAFGVNRRRSKSPRRRLERFADRVRSRLPVRFAQPEPSFWAEVSRNAAKALITFAIVQAGKVALTRTANAAKR